MHNLSRFRFLPLLLACSLAAACTDPAKMVSVANQTTEAHTVTMGSTDFGSVPAGTVSDYLEVDDGTLIVRVDGARVWSDSLGSDNAAGSWTLYLQTVSDQMIVGVSADD